MDRGREASTGLVGLEFPEAPGAVPAVPSTGSAGAAPGSGSGAPLMPYWRSLSGATNAFHHYCIIIYDCIITLLLLANVTGAGDASKLCEPSYGAGLPVTALSKSACRPWYSSGVRRVSWG